MTTQADRRRLRQALTDAGVFEYRSAATATKFTFLVAIALSLYVGAFYVGGGLAIAMLLAAAIPAVTAAMVGHEGAHRSFGPKPWQNELMVHIAFPLFAGLGVLHWKQKHNVQHHGHPNIEGMDEDIDLWPMATSSDVYDASSAPRRFFQRNMQGFMYWPLTLFLSIVMRIQTFRHLISRISSKGIDKMWMSDVLCLVAHYTLWLVIPSFLVGPALAIGSYMVIWTLASLLLALIFTPAHIGLPILQGDSRGWKHQLETTRNLKMPKWLSWFFVGLDYQVEHHLFPKIPHQHMEKASVILKKWCGEVGLPYHEIGYVASVIDSTKFMHKAWTIPVADKESVEAAAVLEAA